MTTGWQCPGCGACYAPTLMQCQYCKPRPAVDLQTFWCSRCNGTGWVDGGTVPKRPCLSCNPLGAKP